MMASWRTCINGRFSPTLAAVTAFALSACQLSQDPQLERSASGWRVIESQGNAKVESSGSRYMSNIHSGDQITGNRRIITGKSTHLIMSRGDLQFTAGSNTSVVLPTDEQPAALTHSYGTMRVRLATAADEVKRITTPHLIANGTAAVFELEVDDQDTKITITSGSVVLSTSNGLHYATLVAGAAARLGNKTNGQLEIQPAAEMPFRPSVELDIATTGIDAARSTNPEVDLFHPAPPQDPTISSGSEGERDGSSSRRVGITPKVAAKPGAVIHLAARPDHQSDRPNEVAILPASRLRAETSEPRKHAAVRRDRLDRPILLPANSTDPIIPDVDVTTGPSHPRQRFDRLTKGLLYDLPTVDLSAYPDP